MENNLLLTLALVNTEKNPIQHLYSNRALYILLTGGQ